MTPYDSAGEISPYATGGRERLDFVFTGTAKDYFGIWIVNLLLTVVTLGIWSAWAKVRRLRFFYGNTFLAGSAFEYHATGKQLLVGRLLVAAALILYSASQAIQPAISGGLFLLFMLAFPWIMNRSLRFNARMTTWRNVRFDFTGSYGEAFIAYLLMPLIGFLSLGILLPRTHRYTAKYVINNLQFGIANFESEPPLWPFYKAALFSLLMALPAIALIIGVVASFAAGMQPGTAPGGPEQQPPNGSGAGIFMLQSAVWIMVLAMIGVAAFYRALVRNAMLSHMTLDQRHEFDCHLSGLRMAWIHVTNLLLTIISLGLLHPWCQVRLWRYQCDRLHALPGGPLDTFIDDQPEAGDAFGSEFADLQAFDFGI